MGRRMRKESAIIGCGSRYIRTGARLAQLPQPGCCASSPPHKGGGLTAAPQPSVHRLAHWRKKEDSVTYQIKAHPTRYKEIEFRSRLEATWAAFFDITGWRWKYEPIDLEGWTPDFEIEHPRLYPKKIFVEVKPTWEQARGAIEKIERTRVPKALLLANGPSHPDDDRWLTGGVTYCHKHGPTLGVVCYFAHGEHPYEDQFLALQPRAVTDSDWAKATNITRWKPA